jgi:hypothetical protein
MKALGDIRQNILNSSGGACVCFNRSVFKPAEDPPPLPPGKLPVPAALLSVAEDYPELLPGEIWLEALSCGKDRI